MTEVESKVICKFLMKVLLGILLDQIPRIYSEYSIGGTLDPGIFRKSGECLQGYCRSNHNEDWADLGLHHVSDFDADLVASAGG